MNYEDEENNVWETFAKILRKRNNEEQHFELIYYQDRSNSNYLFCSTPIIISRVDNMNWNKNLLSPKYFGEKLIFKCRFCHKKEHIENMIVPCSCLSLSHPKCLIKHCRMRSKHTHSGQKKAHSAFDFCQMCENTFCVKKEVKYVTRSPFRKSMFKNRSFKVGIVIISLRSLLISVLSIS